MSAEYLPGKENVIADRLSRVFSDHTEWSLSQEIFDQLEKILPFPLEADMFASRINNKIRRLVSWQPVPLAWRVDALSFPWKEMNPYMFPPFCLVGSSVGGLESGLGLESVFLKDSDSDFMDSDSESKDSDSGRQDSMTRLKSGTSPAKMCVFLVFLSSVFHANK
jgi:hypothetical protein